MKTSRPVRPGIVIADDDHVIRIVRFALEGEGAITRDWVRAFFSPEQVDPGRVIDIAHRLGLHRTCEVTTGTTGRAAELLGLVERADIIILRRAEISAEVIGRAGKLRLVQRLGGRPEGVDLAAAARQGVAVSCLPRRTLAYTAEHALLLMLAVTKQIVRADADTRNGAYDRALVEPIDNVAYNWLGLTGLGGLWGRTLGIVGLGEVGVLVAQRARAFGMRVVHTKRTPLPPAEEAAIGATYRSFQDLLAESDFISVHARATAETEGMFDAPAFARMKPGAIFVNTSRGSLVDENALADALEAGHLGGAGLDTHGVEPRAAHDRIAQLSNVVLTPHAAGGSRTGLLDEVEMLLQNCAAALDGGAIVHRVALSANED